MRKTAALVLSVGLMASLAACSPAAEEVAASDCTPVASGSVSDGIIVSDTAGEVPQLTLDSALSVTGSERTVLTEGDGDVVQDGYNVTADIALYSGDTGEVLQATSFDGTAPEVLPMGQLLPAIEDTLLCSTAGSRVVGVTSAADLPAENLEALGMTAESAMVIVVDIISTEPVPEPVVVEQEFPKAEGEAQSLPEGFPQIDVTIGDDEAGTPVVALPGGDAPADLQIATTITGTGAVVEDGGYVLANYQGIIWRDGSVFNDSWASGAPVQFELARLTEGFKQGITGQTVGSQVLITVPPSLAYGDAGSPDVGILPTDTLVFIVDIVGFELPE